MRAPAAAMEAKTIRHDWSSVGRTKGPLAPLGFSGHDNINAISRVKSIHLHGRADSCRYSPS